MDVSKINFNTFSYNFKMVDNGFITNEIYKLKIQIMNYDNDVFFEKRQFVQMKGYVKIIKKLH